MENWHVALTVVGVGAAVGRGLWALYTKLDEKIERKTEDLSKSHNELAREFAGLKGELRARFDLQRHGGRSSRSSREIADQWSKRVQ